MSSPLFHDGSRGVPCREIYLDGNQLGCQGAYDLIKLLLLNCERAYIEKQDKIQAENDLKAQEGLVQRWEMKMVIVHSITHSSVACPARPTG